MPLSDALMSVQMTYPCPACARAIVKPGSWFKTVSRIKCEGCQSQLRLTYNDKLEIFAKHARD